MLYTCTQCKKEKSENDFYIRKNRLNSKGRLSECKECTKSRNSKRYKKDPDLINDMRAAKTYGLTLEQVQEMREKSGGICSICNREGKHHHKRLVIDHDHKTGKVRDLICSTCNSMIGWCGEDTQTLQNLIDYLNRYK
jgi:DNA-directed RNA polymerase subunit RPC12/RpoP